jgi:hypothetical protein
MRSRFVWPVTRSPSGHNGKFRNHDSEIEFRYQLDAVMQVTSACEHLFWCMLGLPGARSSARFPK